ncbi:glycerophosphodiester phosphodiesterase [Neobacillus sp. MER 74]|uniref:glycerophosphodiester phosphodiesterase n=1 Tax=unclassified Neobacillus TaxID=2675272 RepID=UPI002041FA3A|nr:glycerophosphodiester phosphodiesterase family protein [Neobacillus sp. MER 74]MCM3114181.1 glycerophosphodiester phosphodiesterase [Neobacillus sp. MER 74]
MRNAATLLFVLIMIIYRAITRFSEKKKETLPLKIGHRGAAGYCPENTISSFRKAVELGVDYLELDIQMTKDHELVVIHDPTVNRTTNGKGKVKDFTLQEIQSLDAGSWFHCNFTGEKIPSLSEVFEEFAGKIGFLIELKKPSLYPLVEEKLAEELKKRELTSVDKQIIVQSFDRGALKRFHDLLPTIPIGILIKNSGVKMISNKNLKSFTSYVSYVNPKITMVNKRLIKRIHHHGFKTMIWTVNKKNDLKTLNHFHVEGIISDFPDLS